MFQVALGLREVKKYTFIKGLEGSCDLPRDRTAIIGLSSSKPETLTRLQLPPREYGFTTKNVPLTTTEELITDMQGILTGKANELRQTALWNDMQAGIDKASELINSGVLAAKLQQLDNLLQRI
jgi:anthranilate phosphoribosyltransferase